jgi:hypothetical protein
MIFEEPVDAPVDPVPVEPVEETMGQKIWRFVLGLIGLSSGRPQADNGDMLPPDGMPGEFPPMEGEILP